MLKVGYIGLGLMGKSIARNILKAGFPLVVHNRSQAAVDELVAEGAKKPVRRRRLHRGGYCFHQSARYPRCGRCCLGENGILSGGHPGLI